MTIRAVVENSTYYTGQHIILIVVGFGKFIFNLEKFPSHCGAAILHNVSVLYNKTPTIKEAQFFKEITNWLLKNKRKEANFKRSRIIAADNAYGYIANMARHCKKWQSSNSVVNTITNRNVKFYWLDKNNK